MSSKSKFDKFVGVREGEPVIYRYVVAFAFGGGFFFIVIGIIVLIISGLTGAAGRLEEIMIMWGPIGLFAIIGIMALIGTLFGIRRQKQIKLHEDHEGIDETKANAQLTIGDYILRIIIVIATILLLIVLYLINKI